jgi:hypothetical protein
MKKILIVSTVSRQFYLFEQGNIEVLKSLGYEIHGAANFDDANERLDALDIIRHPFDIQRSPFSLKNMRSVLRYSVHFFLFLWPALDHQQFGRMPLPKP